MKIVNEFVHKYFYAMVFFSIAIFALMFYVLTGQSICLLFVGLFSGFSIYNIAEVNINEISGSGD
jgi:hypothetical protein